MGKVQKNRQDAHAEIQILLHLLKLVQSALKITFQKTLKIQRNIFQPLLRLKETKHNF